MIDSFRQEVLEDLRIQFEKIVDKYGWTEQSRVLFSTMILFQMYSGEILRKKISKRTYYRHMALLDDAGIVLDRKLDKETGKKRWRKTKQK